MDDKDMWRKSSFSPASGGGGKDCVEVSLAAVVGVRDSKQHGRGPVLELSRDAWSAFVHGVKSGAFDRQ